jgi:beta-barrel assembly-enhancing protease
MRIIPKNPDDTVNIPKHHPLLEFLKVFLGFTIFLVIAYFVLGFVVNFVTPHISHDTEQKIAKTIYRTHKYECPNVYPEQQQWLQEQLNKLVSFWSDAPSFPLTVCIRKMSTRNAFAGPGGFITFSSEFFKPGASENEIIMVLSHEMGHYAHRHHLKSLGHTLGFLLLSVTLFDMDSEVTQLVSKFTHVGSRQYSQAEEKEADLFGLNLFVQYFGHAGGATDFFLQEQKLKEKENRNPSLIHQFTSTHPTYKKRVQAMDHWIHKHGYEKKRITYLPENLFID